MGFRDEFNKIMGQQVLRLVCENQVVGFRAIHYNISAKRLEFFDFGKNIFTSSAKSRRYVNWLLSNQQSFPVLTLINVGTQCISEDEANGKIQVLELKDEDHAFEVLDPIVRVYKYRQEVKGYV